MSTKSGYQFGAFQGVFTPSILTILGVVMYLRFGWVLGNVGLTLTIVIVTLSCAVTFLTGLAIAALATNMKIGGGGAYYIISRSLGIEVGAAVGVPLYLAQALGVSFYIAGFSESIVAVWPGLDPKLVGVATLVALATLAFFSASLALRMQYFILAGIVLSLVSFFLGGTPTGGPVDPNPSALELAPFWVVFAVFFPAVTGIEAGISLSGDLKDPGSSLAKGTIGAVVVGYIVYLMIPVFLDSVVDDRRALIDNPLIMRDVARFGSAILVGLWGASVSSALGAILGAPRTLQALATDGVLPRVMARTYGTQNDPRVATVFSFGIALAGVLLGDLNLIAPVLTMFFLTSYGLLNTSASLEAAIGSPTWRPSLKLPWQVHLAGAGLCFAAMLMINTMATFAAIAVALAVFGIVKRRNVRARWGDVRYGISMMMIQLGLRRLARSKPDARTWKPNILVLSGVPTTRWYLIELANAISNGQSLMTVATVVPGEDVSAERVQSLNDTIRSYLKREDIETMVTVLRADTMVGGLESLVSAYGFGPLVPNTVMLGETERIENLDDYVRLVRRVCNLKRNLVIVRESQLEDEDAAEQPEVPHRIDVWWYGKGGNAPLMLALAYQLKKSSPWEDHELVVKTVVPETPPSDEENGAAATASKHLNDFLERERLDARAEVVPVQDEPVFDAIRRSSADAGLVFVGIRPPEPNESLESYRSYYQTLLRNTEGLPLMALVFAAQDLPFNEIFST